MEAVPLMGANILHVVRGDYGPAEVARLQA